jgi:hypothetical protein
MVKERIDTHLLYTCKYFQIIYQVDVPDSIGVSKINLSMYV